MTEKAFPGRGEQVAWNGAEPVYGPGASGMDLRDYFAAVALAPVLAHVFATSKREDRPIQTALAAEYAYATADCMISVRESSRG